MTTRTKTLAGASLVLALALTGCDGTGGAEETSTASAAPISTSPAPAEAGSSTSAPQGSSASASSSQSSSMSASPSAPTFEPVTSDRPEDDQTAQIKAFDALQQFYDVKRAQYVAAKVDEEQLSVAARDPYLSDLAGRMKAFESAGQTYSGESKIELIEPIIGPTTNVQGELFPHTNAQLRVCEDNTGVVVKDKDGNRVSSGSVLRYEITYIVTWQEDDRAWKVSSDYVSRDEKGTPKTC
ncbi:hypothetical protein ACIQ00_10685 [Micrococcus luteus]|uniref:hypothetical protein n=1 Tax=Actinomycetes TaxID=1760 RepID=UPI0030148BD8